MSWGRKPPSRRRYDDDDFYPVSRPIRPTDGIKAKSERGAFGASWWAKRWIGVLESFGWGSRLQRGKSYARNGQVLTLDVAVGEVKAKVQGSQRTPYKVTLRVEPLTTVQWERVTDALAEQAIFAAQLLAGEMPQDIETAFTAAGVPLFPQNGSDIEMRCSCPDAANPCKHIAAVYYLLGERFDEDPFLIFQLRGRTREQIMQALRARRAATIEAAVEVAPSESVPPLADLLDQFYQAGAGLDEMTIQIAAPEMEGALLRPLGDAPLGTDPDLWRVYRAMTEYALSKVIGEENEAIE